jgi:hypothetical protein
MEVPKAEGDLIGFDCRNHTPEEYNALPEWLQKKVDAGLAQIQADEAAQAAQAAATDAGPAKGDDFTDDDIPF